MATEPYTVYEHGWIFKIKSPVKLHSNKTILLLHGWTGDENVMWIFVRHLPDTYCILSPRGPVQADTSGYGWAKRQPENWLHISELSPVTDRLMGEVDFHLRALGLGTNTLDMIGFSQGCAMVYSIATKYPERVDKLAILSGFIPQGCDELIQTGVLADKEIFMAHGTNDITVSIEMAHRDRDLLEKSGASVQYCEETVGHKLGPNCFNGLTHFLSDFPTQRP